MTYSSGGLIQASDYNTFNGATTANVSGTLLSVYSTGKGSAGYGQATGIPTNVVATTDTVAATQWTTFVNAVNVIRKHQSGAGFSNLSTYTAGTTINATNNISSNLTTAFTNRLTYAASGTTTTGATQSPSFTAVNDTNAQTIQFSRTATFANADAARYFFNAGGQLNFVISSITNTGGTSRGADIGNLAVTNFASKTVQAYTSVARTGTGGTLNSDSTTAGYWTFTTANTTLTQITSTATAYTGDIFYFYGKTNGVQGSNSDNGTVVTLSCQLTMGAQSPAFNDSYNVAINHRVDVIYPSTTYLANSWGTVTIA